MLVNTSSSSHAPLPHAQLYLTDFSIVSAIPCFTSPFTPSYFGFFIFNIAYICLLLPLSILVLRHGLQQWQEKPSTFLAASMSHSDSFTYHLVVMELIGVTGCFLSFCALCINQHNLIMGGVLLYSFTTVAEVFVHILTCVERYLAAVHPVIYLSLRKQNGTRTRNVSIGCIWLLSFIETCSLFNSVVFIVMNFFNLITSILVVSFCSLSVLCILTRPGPGEHRGVVKRVDQSKQRAFYTIFAILGVLLIRFVWNLIWIVIAASGNDLACVLIACNLWVNLPSGLLLPLIFLYRTRKSVCFSK